jgi:hypothetical protein
VGLPMTGADYKPMEDPPVPSQPDLRKT